MGKKAIVVISLVKESNKMTNEEIKREISEELSRGYLIIPWCKEVVEVKVIGQNRKKGCHLYRLRPNDMRQKPVLTNFDQRR